VCEKWTFGLTPKSCQVTAECTTGQCTPSYCAGQCTAGTKVGSTCIKTSDCGSGGVCSHGAHFAFACSGPSDSACGADSVCVAVDPPKGYDGLPCTDDDPVSSRGIASNIPTTTSMAESAVIDTTDTFNLLGSMLAFGECSDNFTPCTTSAQGTLFNCPALLAATPSLTGASSASAYSLLDGASVNDYVVTVLQTAK
jgi:hypothetical protein